MSRLARLLLALALGAPTVAWAQGASAPLEPADAPVGVLPVALYNAQANVQEPTDSAKAVLATEVLHAKLRELLPGQIAEGTVEAALSRGARCPAIVSCSVEAARAAGARWAVMGKVSKTSNLIWLFTGQLIHVPTGRIVLDDSTELKGEPEPMVRAGSRIFAERVARTVKAGGVANDFPAAS